VAQTMYTHVSKCKNNKRKKEMVPTDTKVSSDQRVNRNISRHT
jgi:hypothetical protein